MWRMAGLWAALARSRIQEGTKAGRAAATAHGATVGRKPLLSAPQIAHAHQLIKNRRLDTRQQVKCRTLSKIPGGELEGTPPSCSRCKLGHGILVESLQEIR
jgi:DNA invertase Pin-like site-specific DNA recombinase